MPRRSFALFPVLACTLAFPLAAQALPQNAPGAPLRSVVPEPVSLDLRGVDGTQLVPKDNRDAAQAEAVRQRWAPLVAGLKGAPAVRLLLPTGEGRVPLLLAAAQALKAQAPTQRLYVAFDPQAMPLLEETA